MMMSFVDNTTWSSSTFDFISFGFASSFFISRVNIPFQYFSVLRIVSSAKPAPSRETLPLTKFMSSFFRQHHKLEVKWGNSICWFSFSRSSFLALKHKVHRSIQTKASGFFYNFRPDGIIRFTVCGFFFPFREALILHETRGFDFGRKMAMACYLAESRKKMEFTKRTLDMAFR